jgi:hypothetical protein
MRCWRVAALARLSVPDLDDVGHPNVMRTAVFERADFQRETFHVSIAPSKASGVIGTLRTRWPPVGITNGADLGTFCHFVGVCEAKLMARRRVAIVDQAARLISFRTRAIRAGRRLR